MIVKSLDHLSSLAKKVADRIVESDCIFLKGEIGVGKTTFTRYLINHLQEKEKINLTEVLSPTFNLLYEYHFNNFKIMHYDLYRINDEKELNDLGLFNDNSTVIKIIEWPDLVQTPLKNKLEVHLDYTADENERKIKFIGVGKWENFK